MTTAERRRMAERIKRDRRMVERLALLDRTMTDLRETCAYTSARLAELPREERAAEASALARRVADVAERLAEDLEATAEDPRPRKEAP